MPAVITGRRHAAMGLGMLGAALVIGGATDKQPPGRNGASDHPSCTPPDLWKTLPPTPVLPTPLADGTVKSSGASLYYATYGTASPDTSAAGGQAVLLLHGGMANSNYWADVLPALTSSRRVIVMDTRGHGRSTLGSGEVTYEMFAADAVALLDRLAVSKASIVGWSDGGITGLELGMTHPDRVAGLFVFGANFDRNGLNPGGSGTPLFRSFERRCAAEYRSMSPDPHDFGRLRNALREMWLREPNYRRKELSRIVAPTAIADGEYDEIIARGHVEQMAAAIPSAKLVILPCVSHFALLQDPAAFGRELVASGVL